MASSSKTANQTQKLEVLSHRRDINKNLTAALQSLERGDTDDTKQRLHAIQHNILGIEQYLSVTIEPTDYAQIRLSDSTTAAKVFAVPELLESILQHLEVPDLMRCYEISRTFRDTLESSKKLQICLFLLPDSESCQRRFPINTKEIFGSTSKPGRRPKVTDIYIHSRIGKTYTIGSRWKSMLVTQPPIYSMKCFATCDADYSGWCELSRNPGGSRIIQSDEALTIGDLFAAVDTMSMLHEGCEASKDGEPRKMMVKFHGPVQNVKATQWS